MSRFRTLRGLLRGIQIRESVKTCGYPAGQMAGVSRTSDGEHYVSGLRHCGSVWVCPACARRVADWRGKDCQAEFDAARTEGDTLYMVTLTVRHDQHDDLRTLWGGVSKGWHRVTGGKAWKEDQYAIGLVGWVKTAEVTYGQHGWHVHVHAVLRVRRPLGEMMEQHLLDRMWSRWNAGAVSAGLRSGDRMASDIREVASDEYLVKTGLEIGSSITKGGRSGSLTTWQIGECVARMRDEDTLGDVFPWVHPALRGRTRAQMVALWYEWQKGSYRRRQVVWSRSWPRIVADKSDEEIVEEDPADELVDQMPGSVARHVVDHDVDLTAYERGVAEGRAGVVVQLPRDHPVYEVALEWLRDAVRRVEDSRGASVSAWP